MMTDAGRTFEWRLYPLGGNEFGIKQYSVVFRFGEGLIEYGGYTCKKL